MRAARQLGMKYAHCLSCVLFVAACATSDDGTAMDNAGTSSTTDLGQADQAGSSGSSIPAPSLTIGGSSTASVTTSLAGGGLQIDGGFEPASYVVASYQIDTGTMRATAGFTVEPAPGASFTYAVLGTGSGYSTRHLRLQRVPGSDALQAISTNGAVTCGTLTSGQPTPVTVSFDGTARTFDVLMAGAPSGCTGLSTKVSGPITGFRITDETVEGYGGHVEFSDLALSGSP
jgi:hypothetical protein